LHKDGSGYIILHNWANDQDGYFPAGGLTKGSDGALYGSTYGSGSADNPSVYKLWPPQTPEMRSVNRAGNITQVSFDGVSGYHYQLLRSINLVNWSPVTTS